MSKNCGTLTAEGYAVCSSNGDCGCSSDTLGQQQAQTGLWSTIRSGLMFGLACIFSPCCTPILVPLLIAGLAGTPLALWLGAHLGWVYGVLTLISLLSLAQGVRWVAQK